MEDSLTIRFAEPVDQPSFLSVLKAIRAEMGHGNAPHGELENMAHLLCAPLGDGLRHHWLLLAEREGDLVGYCAMHRVPMPIVGGSEGYISDLFVRADARGEQVGHSFLDMAEQIAAKEGFVRLHVINRRDRESHKRGFYPKQGFREREEVSSFVLDLA